MHRVLRVYDMACVVFVGILFRRFHVCLSASPFLGPQTNGIFNVAKAIQEKIDKREAQRQAEVADREQTEEEIVAEYERSKQAGARRGNQSGWAVL